MTPLILQNRVSANSSLSDRMYRVFNRLIISIIDLFLEIKLMMFNNLKHDTGTVTFHLTNDNVYSVDSKTTRHHLGNLLVKNRSNKPHSWSRTLSFRIIDATLKHEDNTPITPVRLYSFNHKPSYIAFNGNKYTFETQQPNEELHITFIDGIPPKYDITVEVDYVFYLEPLVIKIPKRN